MHMTQAHTTGSVAAFSYLWQLGQTSAYVAHLSLQAQFQQPVEATCKIISRENGMSGD
jgi:hypothetical protein